MGTLTGPSFQSAEKRCFHVLHVWEEKLWNQSPSLKKFIRLELCQKCAKIFNFLIFFFNFQAKPKNFSQGVG